MNDHDLNPETKNPEKEEALPETLKVGNLAINKISEKSKKSIASRVLIGLTLAAIAIPCLIYGSWAWLALIMVVAGFTGYEIIRAPQKKAQWYTYALVYLFLFLTVYWGLIRKYTDGLVSQWSQWGEIRDFSFNLENVYDVSGYGANSFSLSVSPIVLGLMLIGFFWLSIAQETFSFTDICYYFTMVLMVGLGLQAALYLRLCPFVANPALLAYPTGSYEYRFGQSTELVIFALLGALLNDTFAYFGGMFFGRHHMNPRVSPKKTWEGFFIGWIGTSLVLCAYCFVLSYFKLDVLPGVFDFDHWYLVLAASLLIPLIGDLGDLSFSLIKRHFVFKDYSRVLGPHGGFLDRIDSCLFTVLGVSVVVMTVLYWSVPAGSAGTASLFSLGGIL